MDKQKQQTLNLQILKQTIQDKTFIRRCPDCFKTYKKQNSVYVVRLEEILQQFQKEKNLALTFQGKNLKREKAYFRLIDNVTSQLDMFLDWAEQVKI